MLDVTPTVFDLQYRFDEEFKGRYLSVGSVGSGAPGRCQILAGNAKLGDETEPANVLGVLSATTARFPRLLEGWRAESHVKVPKMKGVDGHRVSRMLKESEEFALWLRQVGAHLELRHGAGLALPTFNTWEGHQLYWSKGQWVDLLDDQLQMIVMEGGRLGPVFDGQPVPGYLLSTTVDRGDLILAVQAGSPVADLAAELLAWRSLGGRDFGRRGWMRRFDDLKRGLATVPTPMDP